MSALPMRFHSTTPIALGAFAIALALPATAGARANHPAHRSAKPGAAARQIDAATRKLAEVEERMAAMQRRLDSQAAQIAQLQGQTNVAVQAASARADTAVATADHAAVVADHAVVTADAAQVAAAHPAVPEAVKWAANTQVGGRIFFNESTITQRQAGVKTAATGTGFNIKRMYLNVDHKFSPVFSASIVTDISNVIGQTANINYATPTANVTTGAINNEALVGRGIYVKNAFLQAKLSPALIIRAGAAPMAWVPYVENQYGYRQIENEGLDRVGYGYTADWGVHVLGDLGKIVSYQVSVVDGGTFRNVRVTNAVDVEGRVSAQYKGLWGAIGGYVGKRANDVQTVTATPTTFRTARRADAALGYKNALFGVGGEYFYAKDWNDVTVNPATNRYSQDSAQGFSVFANANIAPRWSVFGRYDWVEPNRITLPSLRDHYFNLGVQWEPVKIVDLALVYKREVTDGGAISTTNGVIGCAATATANAFATTPVGCAGNGVFDEIGIFGQVKF